MKFESVQSAAALMAALILGQGSAVALAVGAAVAKGRAPAGSVLELKSRGAPAASIRSGSPPNLVFQASVGEPWKLTGCLRAISGRYLITDEITNVTAEVAGSGLERESGNRVEVTGSLDPAKSPVSGATRYIRVSRVKRLSKNCAAKEKPTAEAGFASAAVLPASEGNADGPGRVRLLFCGGRRGYAALPFARFRQEPECVSVEGRIDLCNLRTEVL